MVFNQIISTFAPYYQIQKYIYEILQVVYLFNHWGFCDC
jgi:hypothetical protein